MELMQVMSPNDQMYIQNIREAQRTQAIESKTWVTSLAKLNTTQNSQKDHSTKN